MILLAAVPALWAGDGDTVRVSRNVLSGVNIEGRVGYPIGGTAPLGMPATIRHLNKFPIKGNFTMGVDAVRPLKGRWGILVGLHFETKAMETDCQVKNYHMEIVKGGEVLAGMFTGGVVTRVRQWMFTIPVQATCKLGNRWRLRFGPYVSIMTGRSFDGWAYDGYLRVDDPTGAKVELGHDEGERGEYDFSEHLRRFNWGLDLGADFRFSRRWSVFADLSWGLNGVFNSDFHTIEQTLYPIYGMLGLNYRL